MKRENVCLRYENYINQRGEIRNKMISKQVLFCSRDNKNLFVIKVIRENLI